MADSYPEGFIGGYMQAGDYLARQAQDKVVTAEEQLKLAAAQDDLAAQQKMVAFATGKIDEYTKQHGGVGPNTAETIRTFAQGAAMAGRPEAGAAMMDKLADAEYKSAEAQAKAYGVQISAFTTFANELDGANITDQKSWSDFWKREFILHPEIAQNASSMQGISKLATQPYSPELVNGVKNDINLRAKQAKIELDKSRAKQADAVASLDRWKEANYYPALVDQAEALAKAREKAGTGKAPSKGQDAADLKYATDMIQSDYRTTDSKARAVANSIVERARELEAGGVARTTAFDMAFKDPAIKSQLAGVRPARKGPGSENMPVQMTAGMTPTEGNWYTGAKGSRLEGKKLFYTGNKFYTPEEIAARKARRKPIALDESDENPPEQPDSED